jgi:hypothetical protein
MLVSAFQIGSPSQNHYLEIFVAGEYGTFKSLLCLNFYPLLDLIFRHIVLGFEP